jgi:hypothetical protein
MSNSDLPNFGAQPKSDSKENNSSQDLFSSLEEIDEDEEEMNKYLLMRTKKTKMDHENNIQKKLSKLYMRMRYAQHKYHDIRRHFTHIGIAIMSISFILTLLEAFRNTMDLNEISNKNIRNFIILIPLILSSLVSFLTALIKFNKYEERIEALIKANEKSIFTISEMKKIREALYLSDTDEQLISILDDFQKNIYPKYLENNVDIERLLTDNDYSKYMDIVNEMDIEYCRKEHLKQKMLQSIKNDNDTSFDSLEIELESIKEDRTEICCC